MHMGSFLFGCYLAKWNYFVGQFNRTTSVGQFFVPILILNGTFFFYRHPVGKTLCKYSAFGEENRDYEMSKNTKMCGIIWNFFDFIKNGQ